MKIVLVNIFALLYVSVLKKPHHIPSYVGFRSNHPGRLPESGLFPK